jgi:hypothetical protein
MISCFEVGRRKWRTPSGTFLSNRTRNAMALGVRHNRLNLRWRELELLGNLDHSQAVVEIIDNGVNWHTSSAHNRSAAQDSWIGFHQGAL